MAIGMQTSGKWGNGEIDLSLHHFTTRVQQSIVFDPKFTGIKARYFRRTEDKEGDLAEDKSVVLNVSPQGNYVATDNKRGEIGVRINVIWVRCFSKYPTMPRIRSVRLQRRHFRKQSLRPNKENSDKCYLILITTTLTKEKFYDTIETNDWCKPGHLGCTN